MTLVDSLDSIFMLHAYSLPEGRGKASWRRIKIFEPRAVEFDELRDEKRARMLPAANQDRLLTVSIVLTVISISIALLISIVSRRRPFFRSC